MKKIKLYDFEGDGKTIEVSLEAILSKDSIVVCDLGKTSKSLVEKEERLDQEQEKRNEKSE